MMRKRNTGIIKGFSLIEIVIVLLVLGIIAMVSYPAYQDVVRKGRRAEATTALLKLQLDQEKWRAVHTSYSDKLDGNQCGSIDATGLCWSAAEINRQYYSLSIVPGTVGPAGFVAIAEPRSGTDQVNDDCRKIVINQSGPDLVASTIPDCWSQ